MTQEVKEWYDYANTLTPYGVSIRYPNELFLEEKHAQKATQYANGIIQWVDGIVKQSESNN